MEEKNCGGDDDDDDDDGMEINLRRLEQQKCNRNLG
jgi:hypothetical protein